MKSFLSETIRDEFKKLVLPTNNPQSFELLTRKESADFLGISLPTLHKLIRQGFIKQRRSGTVIRFERADLESAFSQVNNLRGKGGKNGK